MAKPIFVIKINQWLVGEPRQDFIKKTKRLLKTIRVDYHILFVFTESVENFGFELYNSESDIPPITIEELQEKLLNTK